MKKKNNILILTLALLLTIYIFNKNCISKSNLDFIINMEMNDIMEDNLNKMNAIINGNEYKTGFLYNYYYSKYGNEIFNDVGKLKKIVKNNIEDDYWFTY